MAFINAYVDETGDLGWGDRSSPIFAMSAVVVQPEDEGRVRDALSGLRATFGIDDSGSLQWKKTRSHDRRLHLATTVAGLPIDLVQVVMFKRFLGGTTQGAEALYLYTLRLLLERITWIGRGANRVARVRLAQIRVTGERKINSYLSKVWNTPNTIEWAYLEGNRVLVHRPEHFEILQLADLTAGPINSAFVETDLGNLVPDYLLRQAPALWRRDSSAYPSYGFKVMPGPRRELIAKLEAAHPVLKQLP